MTDQKLCSIEGCGKPAKGRGWCAAHWWRWRNNGDPLALKSKAIKPEKCSVEECENGPTDKRGMCNTHYLRWYRHGDVSVTLRSGNGTIPAWLDAHKGYDGDGCLTWPFARGTDGRGMCHGYETPQAHRVMCIMVNGPPPSDVHEAAHSCGKGHEACVHPKHLRWATPKENAADRWVHGTEVHGERSYGAKLREADIPVIRSRRGETAVSVSLDYGVDAETIRSVWDGNTWRWLK